MWRNPKLRRRILEVLGVIALILILITAFLGAIFTEGLTITISSTHAPWGLALAAPQAGAWTQYSAPALVLQGDGAPGA